MTVKGERQVKHIEMIKTGFGGRRGAGGGWRWAV